MGKRKSESEKSLKGTTEKSRVRVPRMQLLEGYPDPVTNLNAKEREVYERLCNHLHENGALMDADAMICTMFAQSMVKYIDAAYKCRGKGTIQTYKNGTRQISPEYTVFKEERANLLKMGVALGLSPRARLDMEYFHEKRDNEADPFEKIMGKAG